MIQKVHAILQQAITFASKISSTLKQRAVEKPADVPNSNEESINSTQEFDTNAYSERADKINKPPFSQVEAATSVNEVAIIDAPLIKFSIKKQPINEHDIIASIDIQRIPDKKDSGLDVRDVNREAKIDDDTEHSTNIKEYDCKYELVNIFTEEERDMQLYDYVSKVYIVENAEDEANGILQFGTDPFTE